jgi:biotin transport system substrate-specific component
LVAATASLAFLPGDLVKVVIATAVASAVHRGYPGITEASAGTKQERLVSR